MPGTVLDPQQPAAAADDHSVFLYETTGDLASAVVAHVAQGLDAGESALVVVTGEHWTLFEAGLRAGGYDTDSLLRERALEVLDAEETLAAILVAGRPSPGQFDEVVGGALTRLGPGSVRVYGEMVDLLCRRRQVEGARELEALWNRMAARRRFSLLCAYKVDVFDRDAQTSVLPMICAAHSSTVAASDETRFDRAVEAAITDTLGPQDAQKVYALLADRIEQRGVPAAQLALMWVSANMPRTAERVLASAYARYHAA